MKTLQRFSVVALALLIFLTAAPLPGRASASRNSATQDAQQIGALERGYRAGYSDGYSAGYSDLSGSLERDYRRHEDYRRADRAYAESYGPVEAYRDGYRQGFEAGYDAGFERRPFNSNIPAGIARRDAGAPAGDDDDAQTAATSGSGVSAPLPGSARRAGGAILIPSDTLLRAELLTNLSTDASQRGDRFQARVIEPGEYAGAMIDGRVTTVRRPGRVRGTGELQLSFEKISFPDGRWTDFRGQLIEVTRGRSDGVGDVDPEGGVRGRSTARDDAIRVGAGAGIGAVLGAIVGGGAGAAIGAAVGGAVGAGSVLTQRGDDVRLPRGTEMRIRAATDVRVQ